MFPRKRLGGPLAAFFLCLVLSGCVGGAGGLSGPWDAVTAEPDDGRPPEYREVQALAVVTGICFYVAVRPEPDRTLSLAAHRICQDAELAQGRSFGDDDPTIMRRTAMLHAYQEIVALVADRAERSVGGLVGLVAGGLPSVADARRLVGKGSYASAIFADLHAQMDRVRDESLPIDQARAEILVELRRAVRLLGERAA